MKRPWILLAFVASAKAAPKPREAPPAAQVDDVCTNGPAGKPCRRALDGFRSALAAQRDHKADHPLRVSYFGDSLTADDHITHGLRQRFQALLGDGGPGFVFAAPPHPYCEHRAVTRVVDGDWMVTGVSTSVPPDHLLGLGGSAESSEGGTIRLVPTGPVGSLDVHYLAQPHGGTLELVADGKVLATLATGAEHKTSAFTSQALPDGTKRIELRARGRVRLFGATLESKTGAVVDNLGVVNATAKQVHNNNLEGHWHNQLAHRAPDLVVIMYGTNEAAWLGAKGSGMFEHEKLFGELLATVRGANPEASCLVVSPMDQLEIHGDKLSPRESIPAMVEAQHRAATKNACAFWDAYQWMGGKGASADWYRRGLIVKDFQHPTSEGADRIADALYRGLAESQKPIGPKGSTGQ